MEKTTNFRQSWYYLYVSMNFKTCDFRINIFQMSGSCVPFRMYTFSKKTILWPTLLTEKSDDRFPLKYRIPGKLNW